MKFTLLALALIGTASAGSLAAGYGGYSGIATDAYHGSSVYGAGYGSAYGSAYATPAWGGDAYGAYGAAVAPAVSYAASTLGHAVAAPAWGHDLAASAWDHSVAAPAWGHGVAASAWDHSVAAPAWGHGLAASAWDHSVAAPAWGHAIAAPVVSAYSGGYGHAQLGSSVYGAGLYGGAIDDGLNYGYGINAWKKKKASH